MTRNPTRHDPDQKKILNLYAAFGVSLVLTTVPSAMVAIVSILFLAGVLIAAYAIRARSAPDSLAENHATHIIRTIWISGLIAALTIVAGALYMTAYLDYGVIDGCMAQIEGGAEALMRITGYDSFMEHLGPCFDDFMGANMATFVVSAIITAGPVLLYILYRFIRGLSRALGGYRLANPKSWL